MAGDVTIVIPVRNREHLIIRSLESVYSQTHRPLQVVVVDNGSTDGTRSAVADWVAEHAGPGFGVTLLDEPEPGAARARNRGLDAVDTEYVIFHDSDDEMRPTLVERALQSIGDADLVYWKAEVLGLDGRRVVKPFHTSGLLYRQIYNSILSTQMYMAKTSVVRCVGGWDSELMGWDDWELGVRIAMTHPKTRALPEVLTIVYSQVDSLTGVDYHSRRGVWEEAVDRLEAKVWRSDSPDKNAIIDRLDYVRATLAAHYRREGAAADADALLDKAVRRAGRPSARKWLLRMLSRYTASGGRGAYYLWR